LYQIAFQALREELASTERREEEERAAHNATRMVGVNVMSDRKSLSLILMLEF
jgi:hypothetical protein